MLPLVRRETVLLLVGDFATLALSLWLALFFRTLSVPDLARLVQNFPPFIPVFLLSLVVFYVAGLYDKQTKLVKSRMGERIFAAQVANVLIAAVLFFLLPLSIAPKTILVLYLVISVILASLWRFYVAPRLTGNDAQAAVIVGSGVAVKELEDEVNGNNLYRMRIVEHIDTSELLPGKASERMKSAIDSGVRIVIVDTRDIIVRNDLPALYHAMLAGVSFVEFSALYEEIFDRVPLEHIDYAWLLDCLPKRRMLYSIGKRAFDIIASAVGGIVALVFVIPSALFLSFTGTPFIFQERVGRAGKTFRIVKLRTMLFDDKGDAERGKLNRVTGFGVFLRKTRIDELPQLWNIFVGELSFIGPRPELPSRAETYEREIPYYDVRHLITPGLSGFAQIRHIDVPRGEIDVPRTKIKLSYDLYYLKHRSFGLDLSIALKTIRALLAFSGT